MKKNLVLILLFLPMLSFSRMHTVDKWMFGITFSPEYSYRFLSSNSHYDWLAELRDEMEIPKFGYTAGINVSYKFRDKFFVSFGTRFSSKGEATKKYDLIYFSSPGPGDPVAMRTNYSYGFCEIPLTVNYQLFDSSSFFTSLGISADLPVMEKHKNIFIKSDGSESHSSTFSLHSSAKMGMTAMVGIGYYFNTGKNYFLKTEPFFKCNIVSEGGSSVKEYFYSFGLEIGFYLGR